MSIKVLYTRIYGSLTTDISAALTLLPLNAGTLAILSANINFAGGEWTYLRLDNGVYSEEVKVTGISGSYAVVERGASGSTPRAFGYLDTKVSDTVGTGAITDIVAASAPPPSIAIDTAGLAYDTGTPTAPIITVDALNLTGDGTIEVLGAWPNIELVFNKANSGCCGEGTDSTGTGVSLLSVDSTILQGSIVGDTLQLTLDTPNFVGEGGTSVTGVWPNITITSAPGGGVGTVTSVAVGAGLALTGSPTANPTIAMQNTGVTPGTYGGVGINARGQITGLPAGFSPISSVAVADGATVAQTGGDVTITFDSADVGVRGLVALADETAALDPADTATAVTPAMLAAHIGGASGSSVAGSGTGEADALYTAALSATTVAATLAAGETAILIGEVQVLSDSTPLTPVAYGVAVFDAGTTRKFASKIATQSNQSILGILTGPFSGSVHIVTTALPSGATVQSAHLAVLKL